MQHTISVLVENKPGVLARVSGLFARRNYNIDSLAVSTTEDPTLSRMTIVVQGDGNVLEQIIKQLHKLIDVIKVLDHTEERVVEREIALLKVKATATTRPEIIQIVEIFRSQILDVSESTLIIEATGDVEKIDALINMLQPYGILELVRTGRIALVRGAQTT